MNWIFLSITIGGFLSLLFTPLFIRFQKARALGERIRIDGPRTHSTKAGTPTMGGVVIVFASIAAFIIVSLIKYYRYTYDYWLGQRDPQIWFEKESRKSFEQTDLEKIFRHKILRMTGA